MEITEYEFYREQLEKAIDKRTNSIAVSVEFLKALLAENKKTKEFATELNHDLFSARAEIERLQHYEQAYYAMKKAK